MRAWPVPGESRGSGAGCVAVLVAGTVAVGIVATGHRSAGGFNRGSVRFAPCRDPARCRPVRAPLCCRESAAARRPPDLAAHRRHTCNEAATRSRERCSISPAVQGGAATDGAAGHRTTPRGSRIDARHRARRSARNGQGPQAELPADKHPYRRGGGRRRIRPPMLCPPWLGCTLLHDRRRDGRP